MREMYVTGTMHNRARMIVASYLTKHLLTHWRVGLRWFEDCLIDWDPAVQRAGLAMGGGLRAGRRALFPRVQPGDPGGEVRPRRAPIAAAGWPKANARPTQTALSYFDAIPRSWNMKPGDPRPAPPDLKGGRARALDAYGRVKA